MNKSEFMENCTEIVKHQCLPDVGSEIPLQCDNNYQHLENVGSFYKLQKNWDSYNADPISKNCIGQARQAIEKLDSIGIDIYLSVPMRCGGVQLELSGKSCDIEIEFHKDEPSNYLVYGKDSNLKWQRQFDSDQVLFIKNILTA